MTRVALFIDYQNLYKGARRTFGWHQSPDFTLGQVHPRRVGIVLAERGGSTEPDRELQVVRVYRGEPSSGRSPKGQAACQRQVRYWSSQARVEPFTRPLKYYFVGRDQNGAPMYEAHEKGIDVQIAIDMVMGARNDEYDTAILFSGDTDLMPALEAVRAFGKRVEVAAWRSGSRRSPFLSQPGVIAWCHWLDDADYGRLYDPTDYTLPQPGEPSVDP